MDGTGTDTLREPLRELAACGLPPALEIIGERWSLLILRASLNGLVHFEEFQSELGIARNILSTRLTKLVSHGILVREPCAEDRRKVEYRITRKGLDLLPALLALRQWGERYTTDLLCNPVLVDSRDWQPIAPIRIHSHDGRPLDWDELRWHDLSLIGQPVDRDTYLRPAAGCPDDEAAA
jgi:DNA-binding HxlR family transcriptional regulator